MWTLQKVVTKGNDVMVAYRNGKRYGVTVNKKDKIRMSLALSGGAPLLSQYDAATKNGCDQWQKNDTGQTFCRVDKEGFLTSAILV